MSTLELIPVVLGVIFFIGFPFWLMYKIATFTNGKIFKEFTEVFQESAEIPPPLTLLQVLKYCGITLRRAARFGESSMGFYLKIKFLKLLYIPESTIQEKILRASLDPVYAFIELKFKDPRVKPLLIGMKQNDLKNFPLLAKGAKTPSPSTDKTAPNLNAVDLSAAMSRLREPMKKIIRTSIVFIIIVVAIAIIALSKINGA